MTPQTPEASSATDATLIREAPMLHAHAQQHEGGAPPDAARLTTGRGAAPSAWQAPIAEELQDILPQFEVLDFVGRGGMGAVYKARQRSLNRVVAIKLLPVQTRDAGLDFAARFEVEAQAMARLSHPNIVAVHDFGQTGKGQPYYVMEFVEGVDLAQRIARVGKLNPDESLDIALAVCDALACAHREGVVHRDIKPSNILLSRDGKVKVADFGLAKIEAPDSTVPLTLPGTSMGSQGYTAPEVFASAGTADHRADIFSLGVVLYEMLTGEQPRGMFKLPSEKVPGLDPRFDAIMCQAMEEDREDRYQSVAEMRTALEAARNSPSGAIALRGPRTEARAVLSVRQAEVWSRLVWKHIAIAGVTAALALGGCSG